MPQNFTCYPKGLILQTAMYQYKILDYHYVMDKYLIGYKVKNLGTGRVYLVGSSRIHSKRFKIVDPVAKVLFEQEDKE